MQKFRYILIALLGIAPVISLGFLLSGFPFSGRSIDSGGMQTQRSTMPKSEDPIIPAAETNRLEWEPYTDALQSDHAGVQYDILRQFADAAEKNDVARRSIIDSYYAEIETLAATGNTDVAEEAKRLLSILKLGSTGH